MESFTIDKHIEEIPDGIFLKYINIEIINSI